MNRDAKVFGCRRLLAVCACASLQVQPARAQLADPIAPQPVRSMECGACLDGQRVGLTQLVVPTLPDTGRRRAIEYSSRYHTSLTVHRIGSFLELPLFATEYVLGQKLITERRTTDSRRSNLRGPHAAVAAGLGVLFAVNTVTGLNNLYESRHDPASRTRRWIHSIAMLVADAGFAVTAGSAADDGGGGSNANNRHRSLAIGSMSIAAASTVMMWLWRD